MRRISSRCRVSGLRALVPAAFALAAPLPAQAPGTTRWSPDHYIEYVIGNAPIVLSAGHGGDLRPPAIPDRTYGTFAKDTRTLEFAREFAAALALRFGVRPHLVLCHLHRIKLDVNREVVEAAQGNPLAIAAYDAFHQACADARNAVIAQWGSGFYLDLHGHGHPEGWVELGYTLSSTQLALPDNILAQPSYAAASSLRSVGTLPGVFFPEVLRGASSLGGFLQSGGYDSVPSPVNPDPNGGNYFHGGYNVEHYGSRYGGSVDGVQIEMPGSVRSSVLVRAAFLDRIGGWLMGYFPQYRGFDPAAGARITVIADDRVASETGGRAGFVLRRSGSTATARFVMVQWSGTATPGVDYVAPAPLLGFAPGQAELHVPIEALDDSLAEGDESIALALAGGADIGVPSQAEAVLLDDEPATDLALHLPLDDALGGITADASGRGRHGTLQPAGAPPAFVAGHLGAALRCDGSDDRVHVGDFPYAPAGEFTLSFWFRVTTTAGTGYRYLVSHGGLAAAHRLGIYFDQSTGTLRTGLLYGNDLSSLDVLDVTRELRDGQWHHYALVAHVDELVRVYVDGQPETAAMLLGDVLDPAGDFVIGARSDLGSTNFLDGEVDELRLYDRALAPVEIALLHDGLGHEAMVYPGSGDDLVLGTGVNGPLGSGPREDVRLAPGGSTATAGCWSPTGSLNGALAVIVADLFATGSPPVHPLFPTVHTGSQPIVVHGPIALGVATSPWTFAVPAGFAGLSLMLQPIALSAAAPNGVFAAGNAHELRLR
jgi:hypothetical protein